jgi:precorrin-6B methylase 2
VATDLAEIVRNLTQFYDFKDRSVVAVGAGGGQLVEYARQAHRVIAVDQDEAALERLVSRLRDCGLAEMFTVVHGAS